MSQGKVIAVKPLSSVEITRSRFAHSLGAAISSSQGTGQSEGNLVYISVYKGKGKITATGKASSVVWYEDIAGRLNIGDYVEFDINRGKLKSIKGAENVRKLKGGIFSSPGDLLPKVALLASLLLIFTVVVDSKR